MVVVGAVVLVEKKKKTMCDKIFTDAAAVIRTGGCG